MLACASAPRGAAYAGSLGRSTVRKGAPLPTSAPPRFRAWRRPVTKGHGGPPLPPFVLHGDGGDGSRWPRWKVWLFLAFLLSIAISLIILLVKGLARWPLPVLLPLILTCLYHFRTRTLPFEEEPKHIPQIAWWAIAAGAIGFLVSQLPTVTEGWLMLLIGAGGIGGAAGVFTWLLISMLLLQLAAIRMLWWDLRRGGWAP